jgi:hypothetical protein
MTDFNSNTASHAGFVIPPSPAAVVIAKKFRTKMCQNFINTGTCPYLLRCVFAHGEEALRTLEMNLRDNITSEEAVKAFQRHEIEARQRAGLPALPTNMRIPQLTPNGIVAVDRNQHQCTCGCRQPPAPPTVHVVPRGCVHCTSPSMPVPGMNPHLASGCADIRLQQPYPNGSRTVPHTCHPQCAPLSRAVRAETRLDHHLDAGRALPPAIAVDRNQREYAYCSLPPAPQTVHVLPRGWEPYGNPCVTEPCHPHFALANADVRLQQPYPEGSRPTLHPHPAPLSCEVKVAPRPVHNPQAGRALPSAAPFPVFPPPHTGTFSELDGRQPSPVPPQLHLQAAPIDIAAQSCQSMASSHGRWGESYNTVEEWSDDSTPQPSSPTSAAELPTPTAGSMSPSHTRKNKWSHSPYTWALEPQNQNQTQPI